MGEKSGCVGLMEDEREERDGGEDRELNCLYYLLL